MSDILLPGDAGFADVLSGKHFTSKNGYNVAGTMPNNGGITLTPSASQQAIPAGYHDGTGKVPAVVVPAANVLTGTTIAGTAGSMPNNGSPTYTPTSTAIALPTGYISGGSVPAVPVDATKVLAGTTIAGTAGSMPEQGSPTYTPSTALQNIIAGHYSGGTIAPIPSTFKQYATGTGFTSAGNLTVSGLAFQPRVVVMTVDGSETYYEFAIYPAGATPEAAATKAWFDNNTTKGETTPTITSNGFTTYTGMNGAVAIRWWAFQ